MLDKPPGNGDFWLNYLDLYNVKFGKPEINENSIRVPVRVLAVSGGFPGLSQYYYDRALFVFEDVVSSTRKVYEFTTLEGKNVEKSHAVLDGPFSPVAVNKEVFRFEFDGRSEYLNTAQSWDIVAGSLRIEEIDQEALINLAQQRGVDRAVAKAALENADREAILSLLKQIELAEDYRFLIPIYIGELIKATPILQLPEIADLLLETAEKVKARDVILDLSRRLAFPNEKAMSLLRDIIALDWHQSDDGYPMQVATTLIRALYKEDYERALLDSSEPVRVAAALSLEAGNNARGLITALHNDSPRVRQIAAWYMGRKKIGEAVNGLVAALSNDDDIEALRAAIWALGVLRINTVRDNLQPLTRHENALIRKTTQEALAKLTT